MKVYTNLSKNERDFIYIHLLQGKSMSQIAKSLGRDPSTIKREIDRNSCYLGKGRGSNKKYYLPDEAQQKYLKRKSEAGERGKVLKDYKTRTIVIELLKIGYSPGTISGYLKVRLGILISHETIYKFIYDKDYQHLKLWEYLPMKRRRRKAKRGRKVKESKIPNRITINERPEIINSRKDFGHWESDTIEGLRGTGWCLHVSVERYSRKVSIKKIKRKGAKETSIAMIEIFKQYPPFAVKSTTPDNGTEFTLREQVKHEIGIDFYFTNPYSSREKGTVERINGFIRKFFPKGTDFSKISDNEIQAVEDRINNRPMAVLNYYSPNEIFYQLLSILS